MSSYILAHDLGTSGNKATLYGLDGVLKAAVLAEYPTAYPGPGCVEQNPADWWRAVCESTRALMEQGGIAPGEVACVTFSGQMMGCLPVDAQGEPLRDSIIWADTRAVRQAGAMECALGMEAAYRVTGHRVSASYSAAKLLWIRDNEPEVYKKTAKMLQAKDYILHRLTGRFATDLSDASGTNLLDIRRKVWSEDILSALGIPAGLLPDARPSADVLGGVTQEAAKATGLIAGTPVVIGGGDGCCAATGAGVVAEGRTYNVIGSSSWIATATREPIFDPDMRTFNWVHLDPDYYSPCGTMQTAGYSLSWLKNTLCGEETAEAVRLDVSPYRVIDALASQSPPGAAGVLFLPYLLGERSPRWNPEASGAFLGLTMTTAKADMLRAVLEGVGYNLKVILDIFDTASPVGDVTVIGGGAKGAVWLKILSDIWGKPLVTPRFMEEATSLGAAVCGGVGVGAFKDFRAAIAMNPEAGRVEPDAANRAVYARRFEAFNRAYEALRPVYGLLQ